MIHALKNKSRKPEKTGKFFRINQEMINSFGDMNQKLQVYPHCFTGIPGAPEKLYRDKEMDL